MSAVQRVSAFWAGGEDMTMLSCCNCGTRFGISQSLESTLRASQGTFYCPLGHNQYFPKGETSSDRELRLANERAAEAEREANRQRELRRWAEKRTRGANISAGKAKAARNRLAMRVSCGVCPHCKRTVKQMAAHVRSKHPEMVKRK